MDHEQLRLAPDLLAVLRAAVSHAQARGGRFVAPPDLMLALLDDPQVGPALRGLVAHERLAKAAGRRGGQAARRVGDRRGAAGRGRAAALRALRHARVPRH